MDNVKSNDWPAQKLEDFKQCYAQLIDFRKQRDTNETYTAGAAAAVASFTLAQSNSPIVHQASYVVVAIVFLGLLKMSSIEYRGSVLRRYMLTYFDYAHDNHTETDTTSYIRYYRNISRRIQTIFNGVFWSVLVIASIWFVLTR